MAFSGTGKVWMNGKIVDWADATIHAASHVIHYGSGVFEGARCYKTPNGSAFFRLDAHMRRLFDSARIYRMDVELSKEALTEAVVATVQVDVVDWVLMCELHVADAFVMLVEQWAADGAGQPPDGRDFLLDVLAERRRRDC